MVRSYKVGASPTLEETIAARHPDIKPYELSWSSEIMSSCRGYVRVTVLVPKKKNRDAVTYSFDVDLTGPSIHPTDPTTIEILSKLGKKG